MIAPMKISAADKAKCGRASCAFDQTSKNGLPSAVSFANTRRMLPGAFSGRIAKELAIF
jgi:hypothetical protein